MWTLCLTVSVKTNLESACGGAGPQLCADGYEQIGDLYAEAAGAYTSHLTKSGQLVFNVVRSWLPLHNRMQCESIPVFVCAQIFHCTRRALEGRGWGSETRMFGAPEMGSPFTTNTTRRFHQQSVVRELDVCSCAPIRKGRHFFFLYCSSRKQSKTTNFFLKRFLNVVFQRSVTSGNAALALLGYLLVRMCH